MTRVLILGANGGLARNTMSFFLSILDPYHDSAAVVEASGLDYTVLRPGWFTHDPEVNYQLTQKGEPFKGHDVSMNSLSDLIVHLALNPSWHVHESLGVSRG